MSWKPEAWNFQNTPYEVRAKKNTIKWLKIQIAMIEQSMKIRDSNGKLPEDYE